jgi:hypothetical protein
MSYTLLNDNLLNKLPKMPAMEAVDNANEMVSMSVSYISCKSIKVGPLINPDTA